jgi:hypothetical protein
MWISKQFVRRPWALCLGFSIVIFICMGEMVRGALMEVGDNTQRDFLVWGDEKVA